MKKKTDQQLWEKYKKFKNDFYNFFFHYYYLILSKETKIAKKEKVTQKNENSELLFLLTRQ